MDARDDLGHELSLPKGPLQRVVSLVPSLTEALASGNQCALVGATDWCTHPADLAATRVRGTKNPHIEAIIACRPELVIANKEENRELDVRRLREAGVNVWVTEIETVAQALDSMRRLFVVALGWETPGWLDQAAQLWLGTPSPPRARVAVPIWRDPWMVVGSSNFTSDLLRLAGLINVYADHPAHPGRYPQVSAEAIDASGAELILLPDEPYHFHESDGPEVFSRTPTQLVEGRMITWYGPSLVEAAEVLRQIG